jgi:hypothetical protein
VIDPYGIVNGFSPGVAAKLVYGNKQYLITPSGKKNTHLNNACIDVLDYVGSFISR